jgi:hypothetical protein
MVHLPPPPRFNLPPPPMLSSDIFNNKVFFQLTCSSIRQQQHHYPQMPKSRLIAISCITFLTILLLMILFFLIIRFCRRRRSLTNNYPSKPISTQPNTLSTNRSRSYETISSMHTGVYVESFDTSATTYSTDPSSIVCHHCHQERDYSTISPPPYYHTLDILPS